MASVPGARARHGARPKESRRAAVKYLVTVMQGITVEADTQEDAEAKGLAMLDGGFGETVAVEVEVLGKRVACPACQGFGQLANRFGDAVKCDDCGGSGALVEPLSRKENEG